MIKHMVLAGLLLLGLLMVGCSHPVQVLTGPPPTAYRTLGLVSGQGENEASAITVLVNEAGRIDADAVVIEGRRMLGNLVVLNGRAIKYQGPPPQ